MKKITLKNIRDDLLEHQKSDATYYEKFNEHLKIYAANGTALKRLGDMLEIHIKDQQDKWTRIEPAVLAYEGSRFTFKVLGWVIGTLGSLVAIFFGWHHR